MAEAMRVYGSMLILTWADALNAEGMQEIFVASLGPCLHLNRKLQGDKCWLTYFI